MWKELLKFRQNRKGHAFNWITVLGKPGATCDDVADISLDGEVSFATLGAKLGSAVTSVAPLDFLRQV